MTNVNQLIDDKLDISYVNFTIKRGKLDVNCSIRIISENTEHERLIVKVGNTLTYSKCIWWITDTGKIAIKPLLFSYHKKIEITIQDFDKLLVMLCSIKELNSLRHTVKAVQDGENKRIKKSINSGNILNSLISQDNDSGNL